MLCRRYTGDIYLDAQIALLYVGPVRDLGIRRARLIVAFRFVPTASIIHSAVTYNTAPLGVHQVVNDLFTSCQIV